MGTIISTNGQTAGQTAPVLPSREPAARSAGPAPGKEAPQGQADDKVTLGNKIAFSETYAKPAPTSAADMQAILDESESRAQAVMNLILPLVEQQGLNLAKVVSGEQKLNVDQATIDQAKAAIGEDGEYGVKQVAERILNFVKSAAGDDPAKLAAMRTAVEDGFKQAAEMLGGTLPEISEQTRTLIMDTFDRWEGAAPLLPS